MRRLVAVLALAVAACGNTRGPSGEPAVVTAIYPLFEAAERVGGTGVDVSNLTAAGAEPHDLELTTRQLDQIERAGVIVYLGRDFQPAVSRAVERAPGVKLDVLEGQPGEDPHVWLDPVRFKAVVGRIAQALAAADPAGRAAYEANAAAYIRELEDLDAAYRAGLERCDRRVIVTSHAAFGLLADRYGLQQTAIAGFNPESEPSPSRLAQLAAEVRAQGTTTVFTETLVPPDVAEALAREAGVRTAVLDPLEGMSDQDLKAGKTYLSVMRDNLATLRAALGCA